MVLDERSRHRLYLRLEAVLGPDEATTLMEHLPPAGWIDVAMKRDLDAQERRLVTLEFKLLAAFRGELQAALTAQSRQLAIILAVTAGAPSALAFAAARLT